MKNTKKKVKQKQQESELFKVGHYQDNNLKADVSVKGNSVIITVDGFFNEIDALLWARTTTELWLSQSKEFQNNNKTLH
tara:strand:+ start:483 stop:719 length:237 start_codon:yes stop_codon:yes gene_type:complete